MGGIFLWREDRELAAAYSCSLNVDVAEEELENDLDEFIALTAAYSCSLKEYDLDDLPFAATVIHDVAGGTGGMAASAGVDVSSDGGLPMSKSIWSALGVVTGTDMSSLTSHEALTLSTIKDELLGDRYTESMSALDLTAGLTCLDGSSTCLDGSSI